MADMNVGIEFLFFVLLFTAIAKTGELQLVCQHCERTTNPAACTTFKRCQANQVCGVTRIDSGTSLYYNSTCVEKSTCDLYHDGSTFVKPTQSSIIPGPVGKRDDIVSLNSGADRKRATLFTTACCSQTLCNDFPVPTGYGHAQQGTTDTQDLCLVCDGVHANHQSCTNHDICMDTQVCHTSIVYIHGAVRYRYGCEERHVCEAMIRNSGRNSTLFHPGRRDVDIGVHLCDACCVGNLCNQKDCFALVKNMTLASLSAKPH